jgi:hypothetical protein
VDRRLPTDVFQSEWLHRIITGIRRLTPHEFKARAAPITLDILEKITSPDATTVDELNLDAACKVVFAGFLRSGEFLHDDRLDRETFENTSLTRSDVTFAKNDEYAQYTHSVNSSNWTHVHTTHLYSTLHTAALPTTHLSQSSKSEFVVLVSFTPHHMYKGHSFCRGAAQQASNNGLPEADIQALGRWTSQAFKAYFKTIDS